MENCIFCKIAEGKIPGYKVYEDREFLSFLDINPNTKGMTIVIPKKHYGSYLFDLDDKFYIKFMKICKKIAKQIDKNLDVKRTAFVFEGMGIDHLHVKLYSLHGLKNKFQEMWTNKKIFFEKYEGYITTQLGPKADDKELEETAKMLRK